MKNPDYDLTKRMKFSNRDWHDSPCYFEEPDVEKFIGLIRDDLEDEDISRKDLVERLRKRAGEYFF